MLVFLFSYISDLFNRMRKMNKDIDVAKMIRMESRIIGSYTLWAIMRVFYGKPGDYCDETY